LSVAKTKAAAWDATGSPPGKIRFPALLTWKTLVQDVGTDGREDDLLGWTVETGVLEGAEIPAVTKKLLPVDTAFNVLAMSVIGRSFKARSKLQPTRCGR